MENKKVFIFSPRIARDLLKNGYQIIDIAENQKNKEWVVFVFEETKGIRKYLKDRHNIALS